MKVVILAGGFGTRISEETSLKPKPMIEIGTQPLLWHIMKIYSSYGFNEFVICLGYKGYMIKEYFANYLLHQSDVTIDLANDQIDVDRKNCEPWKISLIDTGLNTMTGGRIKRIHNIIGEETFFMTYGDGVADIDLAALLKHHRKYGKYATVTAIRPANKFGSLSFNARGNVVKRFVEKPEDEGGWINGGFFVLEPQIFDFIDGDETSWERKPLEQLAKSDQLVAYRHRGFWRCVDTLRDKEELTSIWNSGGAPWKIWK
jgi:glucose-1-phosphate cytidylyltransferase